MFVICDYRFAVLGLALMAAVVGCGKAEEKTVKLPPELDPIELLRRLEEESEKRDPRKFTETELGKFKISRITHTDGSHITLHFTAFAVLPEARVAEFNEKWLLNRDRSRDAVMSVVQKADWELFSDPALETVKSEMVKGINRSLGDEILRDIAFSEFGVDPR